MLSGKILAADLVHKIAVVDHKMFGIVVEVQLVKESHLITGSVTGLS